jgi:hypothetical protein
MLPRSEAGASSSRGLPRTEIGPAEEGGGSLLGRDGDDGDRGDRGDDDSGARPRVDSGPVSPLSDGSGSLGGICGTRPRIDKGPLSDGGGTVEGFCARLRMDSGPLSVDETPPGSPGSFSRTEIGAPQDAGRSPHDEGGGGSLPVDPYQSGRIAPRSDGGLHETGTGSLGGSLGRWGRGGSSCAGGRSEERTSRSWKSLAKALLLRRLRPVAPRAALLRRDVLVRRWTTPASYERC